MPLPTHGDRKYQPSSLLGRAEEWDGLRVEERQVSSGAQSCVTPECTELVYILSGQATVTRTGDGIRQEAIARQGTSWLVPAGTHETQLELDGSSRCLMIFLPAKLLDDSALADFDIDPDRTRLAYAGGFSDPALAQIGTAMHGLLGRDLGPIDRIFVDGLRTALAARLIGNYTVDSWRQPVRAPSLEPRRLRRVLDFIAANLATDISLDDLANQACLSPYHFSRLFNEATGHPPHRYVLERRVVAAQRLLSSGHLSIGQVALETGFGSQADFARVFRRITGITARQHRELYRHKTM